MNDRLEIRHKMTPEQYIHIISGASLCYWSVRKLKVFHFSKKINNLSSHQTHAVGLGFVEQKILRTAETASGSASTAVWKFKIFKTIFF